MRRKKQIIMEAAIAILVLAAMLAIIVPRFMNAQTRRQIMDRQRELQSIVEALLQYEIDTFPKGLHPVALQANSNAEGFGTVAERDFEHAGISIPSYQVTLFYRYVITRAETDAAIPACNITYAVGAPVPPFEKITIHPAKPRNNADAKKSVLDFFDAYDVSNGIHSDGDMMVRWAYHIVQPR